MEGIMEEVKNSKVVRKFSKAVRKIAGKAERAVKKAATEEVTFRVKPKNVPAAASTLSSKPRTTLSQDEFNRRVQRKAYELYSNRGGRPGNELNDWCEAEAMVRAEIRAGL